MVTPISQPPPASYSQQALKRMDAERKLHEHEKFTFWGVIWVLFAFKLGTIAVILIVGARKSAWQADEGLVFIAATSWYWLFIPAIALSGYVTWKLRLRKMRKQAGRLRTAEFGTMREDDLTDEERERLRQVAYLPEQER